MPDLPLVSSPAALESLLAAVLESPKYRDVCPDLICRLGTRELQIRRNLKDAVKETKNTLHQIAGAYLPGKMRYEEWLALLRSATQEQSEPKAAEQDRGSLASEAGELAKRAGDSEARAAPSQPLQRACVEIMAHHASTRERLPLLSDFYRQLFGDIARERPIRSVLDLACGLNPLALGTMPLAPDAAYFACDIFGDMMRFLADFFALSGVRGEAMVCDVAAFPPSQAVDVALVLKALPPLEASDRGAGLRLLRALNAQHIVVSFPTRSLGGRGKGMAENYGSRFRQLIAAEPWIVRQVEFPGELCFVLSK